MDKWTCVILGGVDFLFVVLTHARANMNDMYAPKENIGDMTDRVGFYDIYYSLFYNYFPFPPVLSAISLFSPAIFSALRFTIFRSSSFV